MPTNNFKLFDEKKANMMSDDDYAINQQRLNGVQSGVASSQLQNKTLYQTALMCYALAQLMAANGYDANDANAVSTFVNNLSLSMVQKVVDKASAADVTNKIVGKWVDAAQLGDLKKDVADNYLPLLGGTMLGDLILNRDPIFSLQAATKQYVDNLKSEIITYTGVNNSVLRSGTDYTLTKTFTRIEPKILFFFRATLEGDVASYYPAFYIKNDSNSYKVNDNATKTNIYIVFNGKEITFHETSDYDFRTEINRKNCNYTILGIE